MRWQWAKADRSEVGKLQPGQRVCVGWALFHQTTLTPKPKTVTGTEDRSHSQK